MAKPVSFFAGLMGLKIMWNILGLSKAFHEPDRLEPSFLTTLHKVKPKATHPKQLKG